MQSKSFLNCVLVFVLAVAAQAAVRGSKAMYVGGTLAQLGEKAQGQFALSGEEAAVFTTKKGQVVSIPYRNIESLEYGQKAGRRVGVALTVTPFALLSKKRKHYLTISYTDESGQKQGAVFELAKGIVRSTLSTFETRSGKPMEYESEEARKHAGD